MYLVIIIDLFNIKIKTFYKVFKYIIIYYYLLTIFKDVFIIYFYYINL